ncbi:MAG: NUDIX domain-containing protein [Verrucomicrobia bacterium]|nr:NUDIX domain-containing protein [Verrucomicrobiota bacterium]
MERPKVGVGVVVISQGKLLLGKRKGAHGAGFWSTAGGHLENGESVEECARRELFEETGLEAASVVLGPWTNNIIDGTKHYVTLFVFVDAFRGEVQLKEPHKCEGWHWFDANALPDPLFPTVVTMIEKVGLDKIISSSAKRSG